MSLKKTVVKSAIVQLSALVLLCCPAFCYGQDDANLKEFDNRYEGETTQQISGSANLKLISFISYFQDFDWQKGQKLFIRFQLEETKPVHILVQQTKGNIIYRMKPKEFQTAKGSNEFGPWPVDDVLSTLELRKDNLGITITDGTEFMLYPATVFRASDSIDSQNYLFQFLPGKSLIKVKFSVYQGLYKDKEIHADSLIYTKDFKDKTKHGGEPFQLFIEKKDIKIDPNWQGWLTLTMKAKDYENYSNVEALYFFYHSPDPKTSD